MTPPSAKAGSNPISHGESMARPTLKLMLYPDQVLRTPCRPVETFDSALRDFAEEMLMLMRRHAGIGLAAPQIGLPERLFVSCIEDRPFMLTNLEIQDCCEPRDFVEGCLSLPDVQVNLRRPERIRITGYDLHGRRRSYGATGLWARVIQHELDHLNGVLICDRGQVPDRPCAVCPLALPAVLAEERMSKSRPRRSC